MGKNKSDAGKFNTKHFFEGYLLMLIVIVGLFFGIRNMAYNKVLKTFQNNITSNVNNISSQFDVIVQSDMTVLSEVARMIGIQETLKSSYTEAVLKGFEGESCFSGVYIINSNGTIIDSSMRESRVGIESVSGFFTPDKGIVQGSAIGKEGLMMHVPVVEGNVELAAVYDLDYLIDRLGAPGFLNGVTEFILMYGGTGDVVIDVRGGIVSGSDNENFFSKMERAEYNKGYNFDELKSDIQGAQDGFTVFYNGEQGRCYSCYSHSSYGGLYIVQILPYTVVLEASGELMFDITRILGILVMVYIVLLIFALYINRKGEKENQEIRMQVRVAELANDAKTNFLSNMSHDIRTPLNAIVGLADICEMNADNPERVRECIVKQKAASEHLMTLINDVLEMNKIESGKVVFVNEEFSIGMAIHNIVDIVQPKMNDKNLKFNVSINNLVHENVIGDGQRIKRAVLNIISNAIKFTGNGGTVSVVIDEAKSDREDYAVYSFTISDTGIGMSEEFVKKIFVPFERMQDSTVSRIEGAGLGMTIAHDLIESLGGSIGVKSKLGNGTTVTVSVPLKIAGNDIIPEQYRSVIDYYKGQYVIVVDNDVIMVEWMDKLISMLGMKCISTTSGSDALDVVKKMHDESKPVALMIFGWKMPKMSGTELASRMREIVGNDIPIILQTVHDSSNSEDEIRTSGINRVMVEPIFRGDIMEVFYEMVNGGSDSKMTFPDFTGKRVLLVEDHRVNAEIISEYLSYTGVGVDVVYDGTEAVEKMEVTPDGYYDLIFMDIRMPKMNGYDATMRIRAMRSDYTQNIPIIALSANAFIEDKKNSQKAGMNGHLAKPVKYEEIYAELKKWFQGDES